MVGGCLHLQRAVGFGWTPATAAYRQSNKPPESDMGDSVYKIIELVGTSKTSWEDAAKSAITKAAKTLRELRVAEVSKLDMVIEDGNVTAYRARVTVSFKYED